MCKVLAGQGTLPWKSQDRDNAKLMDALELEVIDRAELNSPRRNATTEEIRRHSIGLSSMPDRWALERSRVARTAGRTNP